MVPHEDYSRVRARLLNIPSKVVPYLVDMPDPARAAETVRKAIHEAVAELSVPETLLDAGAGARPK